MARIEQRLATDCGIATLANAVNITYEQAHAIYGADRAPGVSIQETCAALYELGYIPVYIPLTGFAQLSGISGAKTQNPEILKSPAILQVLSNNVLHQVFFDGKSIIDPSPKCPNPTQIGDYECVVDAVFVIKAVDLCSNAFVCNQIGAGDLG
jgi:hypothetical protein